MTLHDHVACQLWSVITQMDLLVRMKTGLVPRHDCLGIPVIVQISRTYYRTPQGLVEGSVVEAQQSGPLIAGAARDIGPMLWVLLLTYGSNRFRTKERLSGSAARIVSICPVG